MKDFLHGLSIVFVLVLVGVFSIAVTALLATSLSPWCALLWPIIFYGILISE